MESDWTRRYPWIAEAALKNRQKHFVIDGDAVIHDVDGISDFSAQHSRRHDHEVQLYASTFWRSAETICASCPCTCAKPNLEQLLARRLEAPRATLIAFSEAKRPPIFRYSNRLSFHSLSTSKPLGAWPHSAADAARSRRRDYRIERQLFAAVGQGRLSPPAPFASFRATCVLDGNDRRTTFRG